MKLSRRQLLVICSILFLIVIGHLVAKIASAEMESAWIYVALFYGAWILLSLILLLKKTEVKSLLLPGMRNALYILPALFSIPLFVYIFMPNKHLLKWDAWLAMNIFICLVNPWLEEFYWRGLISKVFKNTPVLSFILSAVGFAASHPIIFGVNSPGARGLPALFGAFVIGAIWWICLHKTKSLRGCIITHFVIDVACMAVYVLADKIVLIKVPF